MAYRLSTGIPTSHRGREGSVMWYLAGLGWNGVSADETNGKPFLWRALVTCFSFAWLTPDEERATALYNSVLTIALLCAA